MARIRRILFRVSVPSWSEDLEADAAKQREEEERIEREVMAAKKEQAAAREEREKASGAKGCVQACCHAVRF